MALLEADVHFRVAKDFIARVKDKALGEEVLRSVTPGQQIVKIFQDELTALLGGDAAPLDLVKAGPNPHRGSQRGGQDDLSRQAGSLA